MEVFVKSLSKISNKLAGQPMFQLLSKIQKMERKGEKIIHFELGEPDFDTPKKIQEACCEAIKNGMTHYTSSLGYYDFRLSVQKTTKYSRGFTPDINQILVTPGANSIIYYAIKCLVNPGEEVIVPNPCFSTYFSAINACGVKAVSVPIYEKNNFRLNPNDLEKAITDKTRLIIINSPSNPTGSILTSNEVDQIVKIVKQRDIYLVSDEIYSRLNFSEEEGFETPSLYDKCKERTIVINGFSKAYAMTGWRLGVAIGPEVVIEKMGLLNETIVSCVPPFIQQAGIVAIEENHQELSLMKSEYKRRRDYIVAGLNSLKGVSCIMPEGAIYAFPNITETGMSSDEFADFSLNEAQVALLPGNNFGEYGEGYVRLSYVTGLENIEIAINRLGKALRR